MCSARISTTSCRAEGRNVRCNRRGVADRGWGGAYGATRARGIALHGDRLAIGAEERKISSYLANLPCSLAEVSRPPG